MADAAERLVNLALYLASLRGHASAQECRGAGLGYPDDQETGAFLRMFERDKDALRAAGFVIAVSKVEEVEKYRIDAEATFARPVALAPDERSAVRAVAAALADDPGFPFGDDLVLALGKLGAGGASGTLASSALTDESPAEQAAFAQSLAEAVQARKTARFAYTNAAGEQKQHDVEPYGLFFRDGRWYLVALDRDIGEVRIYAVGRMNHLSVNERSPQHPDFERPTGFEVRDYERLPFQLGGTTEGVTVRFAPDVAWRAERLSGGRGALDPQPDGSALWAVECSDSRRLARWIVDAGPGISPVAPPALVDALRGGLEAVIRRHG